MAIVQLSVILVIGWLWMTGSSDASATTVDWAYVGLVILTPIALGLSALVGWRSKRRAVSRGSSAVRSIAAATQWTTLGLLALSLLFAPIGLIGGLIFDPMG